ncbi:hypothetical protein VHEMI01643 [[Torrubiella] hemipterigena]|uniref:Uncharacterized protein n=1 Tax=[Torrubiella] hemipterigena TaxID=1531966 RepID=A0A0A1T5E1_9HYPO|nr:hypothetical protein VHEMI01643 [[Torrubiella] hemipterigena]
MAAKGIIHYPWDNEPTSVNSNGHRRATWGFNDCVKLQWNSSSDSPFQWLHLECNEGPDGTNPPWDRVWANNSTAPSGNGSSIFCLANSNPTPPLINTCRFVLELGANPEASTTFTAFSPGVSLDVGNRKKAGSTYPIESTSSMSSTSRSSSATATSTNRGSSTVASSATSIPASAQTGSGGSTSPGSSSNSDNSSSGLSTAAKAGIGAGVGVAVLAALAVIAFILWRKRRSTGAPQTPAPIHYNAVENPEKRNYVEAPGHAPAAGYYEPAMDTAYNHENNNTYHNAYGNAYNQPPPKHPQELGSGHDNSVAELPGSGR